MYPCSRCNGEGRLWLHANVLGGVCFKCRGSGKQTTKPRPKLTRWAVFGEDRNTGARARLYNVDSHDAQGAIEKARNTFECASTAFRDQYTLANASAVPATEADNLES